MADNKIRMPSAFGGIVRYDEEYKSKFMLKPVHVIVFIVLVIAIRIGIGFFLK
jgi:preprotein translocase subunit Sec61beta